MRLGVVLPNDAAVELALAAEAVGIPFVYVAAAPGTESIAAATVVTATSTVRIAVAVELGEENPVTIAEEIAVLDIVSNGRIVAVADVGALDADAAVEDVAVLRAAWSGRPLQHQGRRWQVPARLPGHAAPPAVMVTPPPAQLTMPLWVTGEAAPHVGTALALPVLAGTPANIEAAAPIAPGRTALTGDLDTDRATVVAWAAAGATHLLCELADAADLAALARWLVPEAGMVAFPRVVADAPLPAPWPRSPTF